MNWYFKESATTSFHTYLWLVYFRIVRNKAAEKAKQVGGGGGQVNGGHSPQPTSNATSVIAHAPPAAHEPLQQRPSYSINGILGIPPQPGDHHKRKRDDNGQFPYQYFFYYLFVVFMSFFRLSFISLISLANIWLLGWNQVQGVIRVSNGKGQKIWLGLSLDFLKNLTSFHAIYCINFIKLTCY